MSENTMPSEGQAWLGAVERRLASIEPASKLEIIDGLRAHILDALDGGDDITSVLGRLDSPAAVADQAMSDFGPMPSEPPAKYLTTKRLLQFVAFGLTVAATLIVGFLPSYTATRIGDDGEITATTTNGFQNLVHLSPYFVGGMVLALLITIAPQIGRDRTSTTVSIVAAVLLAFVTVASIVLVGNWLLAPPAIVMIVAALIPQRSHKTRVRLVSARARPHPMLNDPPRDSTAEGVVSTSVRRQ